MPKKANKKSYQSELHPLVKQIIRSNYQQVVRLLSVDVSDEDNKKIKKQLLSMSTSGQDVGINSDLAQAFIDSGNIDFIKMFLGSLVLHQEINRFDDKFIYLYEFLDRLLEGVKKAEGIQKWVDALAKEIATKTLDTKFQKYAQSQYIKLLLEFEEVKPRKISNVDGVKTISFHEQNAKTIYYNIELIRRIFLSKNEHLLEVLFEFYQQRALQLGASVMLKSKVFSDLLFMCILCNRSDLAFKYIFSKPMIYEVNLKATFNDKVKLSNVQIDLNKVTSSQACLLMGNDEIYNKLKSLTPEEEKLSPEVAFKLFQLERYDPLMLRELGDYNAFYLDRTLLMEAVGNNSPRYFIEHLLAKGANPGLQSSQGSSALLMSMYNMKGDRAQFEERLAVFERLVVVYKEKFKGDLSPFVVDAFNYGKLECFRILLANGASPDALNVNQLSLLTLIINDQNIEFLKVLLKYRPTLIWNDPTYGRRTYLAETIAETITGKKFHAGTKLLLDAGANPNEVSLFDNKLSRYHPLVRILNYADFESLYLLESYGFDTEKFIEAHKNELMLALEWGIKNKKFTDLSSAVVNFFGYHVLNLGQSIPDEFVAKKIHNLILSLEVAKKWPCMNLQFNYLNIALYAMGRFLGEVSDPNTLHFVIDQYVLPKNIYNLQADIFHKLIENALQYSQNKKPLYPLQALNSAVASLYTHRFLNPQSEIIAKNMKLSVSRLFFSALVIFIERMSANGPMPIKHLRTYHSSFMLFSLFNIAPSQLDKIFGQNQVVKELYNVYYYSLTGQHHKITKEGAVILFHNPVLTLKFLLNFSKEQRNEVFSTCLAQCDGKIDLLIYDLFMFDCNAFSKMKINFQVSLASLRDNKTGHSLLWLWMKENPVEVFELIAMNPKLFLAFSKEELSGVVNHGPGLLLLDFFRVREDKIYKAFMAEFPEIINIISGGKLAVIDTKEMNKYNDPFKEVFLLPSNKITLPLAKGLKLDAYIQEQNSSEQISDIRKCIKSNLELNNGQLEQKLKQSFGLG